MNHPTGRPLVYGHRGARADEPENTLRSFRRAIELGADGIELDVRVSADGHLVIIHDAAVDRTTDGSGEIASLALADIQALDAGQGERIPTFEEAMAVCTVPVQIEIKAFESVAALAERDRHTPLPDGVVLTSFSERAVEEAARLLPHVPRGLITHHPGDDMLARALDLKADWVCPELKPGLDRALVEKCHAASVRVDAWPAADEEKARMFAEIGADAVTTDFVAAAREWLAPGRQPA
ncbi:glycerophosphodiester phosphodiesterase [Streptomyces sp. NPDC050560]|uniref:glycerophosphodiester phosphodiesterase n=1 Tax=Streptomyces sp. NPDC050560 TaxID=3365630 RepID=UPI0037A7AF2F